MVQRQPFHVRKNAPRAFHDACRTYGKALKAKRNLENSTNIRKHERAFRNNPWLYAKKCCSGKNTRAEPNFSAETAYAYFQDSTASSHQTYQTLPEWVNQVMPFTERDEPIEFDLSAITPGTIRKVLKSRPSNSSPGEDEITYHHLKKLPSAHHFLATLFSKILLQDHAAPESWCQAKIILIPKNQDLSNPENFRPIALTSAIGKLFNKILVLQLERFLRDNDIIDTSLQKGFLTNINGTMEHIFATSAIIQNAVQNGLPLSVTFLNLKNAFGSVPHQLIYNMLAYIQLPLEVGSYISSAYSQLTARVVTKNWSTPSFPISKGVFQGDTLSPLIFLITFNPIIQLAQSLSTCGFQLKLSDSTTQELRKVNSNLYVQWDEVDSDEPQGWYLAKVISVSSDGTATVLYRKGKTLETFNLFEINWFPAPGNGKWYLSNPPSTVTTTSTKHSKTHKVKGFADDFSVFSSSMKKRP